MMVYIYQEKIAPSGPARTKPPDVLTLQHAIESLEQCEPCREIIIFFAVSDASPYIAASTGRAGVPATRPLGTLTAPITMTI
jgi:hypothetical protein